MENVLFENRVNQVCRGIDGCIYWIEKWECYYPEGGKDGIRYMAKRVVDFKKPAEGNWEMQFSPEVYYLKRDEIIILNGINTLPNEVTLPSLARDWVFRDLCEKYGEAFAIYYLSDLDNFNPEQFSAKYNLKFNLKDIEQSFKYYIDELQYHYDIIVKINKKILQ